MRFLIDADLPYGLKSTFASHGHDAVHVRDLGLSSASDERVYHHAVTYRQFLVTRDLDFSDIRIYPPPTHSGMIILRVPSDWTVSKIQRIFDIFLRHVQPRQLIKALIIVEPGGYRIRRIP